SWMLCERPHTSSVAVLPARLLEFCTRRLARWPSSVTEFALVSANVCGWVVWFAASWIAMESFFSEKPSFGGAAGVGPLFTVRERTIASRRRGRLEVGLLEVHQQEARPEPGVDRVVCPLSVEEDEVFGEAEVGVAHDLVEVLRDHARDHEHVVRVDVD